MHISLPKIIKNEIAANAVVHLIFKAECFCRKSAQFPNGFCTPGKGVS